ncbi:MAG TPA: hypothetical protein VFF06_22980 [Polyangia bacterium]|nr:hypothetical protein [Polyangia bacterium]
MKRLLALTLWLGACGPGAGAGDAGANPPRLWLALNGAETLVQLVPVEPDPF